MLLVPSGARWCLQNEALDLGKGMRTETWLSMIGLIMITHHNDNDNDDVDIKEEYDDDLVNSGAYGDKADGIQRDWSFQQHGVWQYFSKNAR